MQSATGTVTGAINTQQQETSQTPQSGQTPQTPQSAQTANISFPTNSQENTPTAVDSANDKRPEFTININTASSSEDKPSILDMETKEEEKKDEGDEKEEDKNENKKIIITTDTNLSS